MNPMSLKSIGSPVLALALTAAMGATGPVVADDDCNWKPAGHLAPQGHSWTDGSPDIEKFPPSIDGVIPGPQWTDGAQEFDKSPPLIGGVTPGPTWTDGFPAFEKFRPFIDGMNPGPTWTDGPILTKSPPHLNGVLHGPDTGGTQTPEPGNAEFTLLPKPTHADQQCTAADVNEDHFVNEFDLQALFAAWGTHAGPEDCNGDGCVDAMDVMEVLSSWGLCE